jgi:transcriptional antiterminator RfaH
MACIRPPLTQRAGLPQPLILDLDDAKEQFLHSYPLLTVDIEAPFAGNVKVIIGMLRAWSIFDAICYHPRCDLLAWRLHRKATAMKPEKLMIQPGLRWYAIQTKGNKEKEVAKRLTDLKFEVFLPWLRDRRRIGSKYHWVLVPLFPGYLFCRLDVVVSGKTARYSPGVKDFLRVGNEITEIPTDIIVALQVRCPGGIAAVNPVSLNAGDSVSIKEGPFVGLQAIFEKKMKGAERVAVLLELLGRQTRLILPSEIVTRV